MDTPTKYYYEDKIVKEVKNENGSISVFTESDNGTEMIYTLSQKRYDLCVKEDVEESNPTTVFDAMAEAFTKEVRELISDYGFNYGEVSRRLLLEIKNGYENDIKIAISKKITGDLRAYGLQEGPIDLISYKDID